MILTVNILGWCGASVVLFAYVLVSLQYVKGNSLVYQSLNMVGAILLLSNTAYFGAIPSSFLNSTWAIIAFLGVCRYGIQSLQ